MKKLLFLFLMAFAVQSCDLDDTPKSDMVLMPVESVTMPASYTAGNVATILVKYRRPTDCHIFNGFYHFPDNDAFADEIAIQAVRFNENNCMDDSETLFEVPMHFTPNVAGNYVFKFWIGNDANGLPEYIVENIVVE